MKKKGIVEMYNELLNGKAVFSQRFTLNEKRWKVHMNTTSLFTRTYTPFNAIIYLSVFILNCACIECIKFYRNYNIVFLYVTYRAIFTFIQFSLIDGFIWLEGYIRRNIICLKDVCRIPHFNCTT